MMMIRWSILGMMMVALTAPGADWPQWRGPNRDGISQETGWLTAWPASGLPQLWKFEAGIGNTVWCLDAATVSGDDFFWLPEQGDK